jgi:tRNA (guanine-N7-)-methyltransferase
MSRLKLKRFRVETPAPSVLAKYLHEFKGEQIFHKWDTIPPLSSEYLFGNIRPLVLDLGCGRGEFLTMQAGQNPALNFVGIEVHLKSVWSAINRATDDNLENVRFIKADVRRILPKFPTESVQTVYLLFPPPHLEYKRLKKDILNLDLINAVHQVLMPGGEFFFVTDNPTYFGLKRGLIETTGLLQETDISTGFEGGITRFQRFWEQFGIPSLRVRYIKPPRHE